jgi:hypothetical protein
MTEFTATDRETLTKLRDDEQVGVPLREPELAAIDAALAEIDRLTAELDAMQKENPPPFPRLTRRPLHWKAR